ncbi:hypothetical protein [Rhizobium sp. F40D2]|uniref:hypothetical protein n=1 Tax=Rhizobium sp. F40D2 TaxID=3453141 RepID=UPI003F215DE9
MNQEVRRVIRCVNRKFGKTAPQPPSSQALSLGFTPRPMEASVDPRVKPEDDGVWGGLWSKDSEDGIPATDPKISGRLNIPLLAIGRGTHRDGVKPIARKVDAIEEVADDFRDFLCGSAFGVFFLHAASHKLFQI